MPRTTPTDEPPTRRFHLRGRHRKPRPRKALPAAGALTLAAGTATLLHLATLQGDTSTEAGPHPARTSTPTTPATTPSETEQPTASPTPDASPSSPTALGGKNPIPLTPPGPATPTLRPPTTTPDPPTREPAPPHSTTPSGQPRPTTSRPSNTPKPTPPADGQPPAPHPPDDPATTPDPRLCVPIIGLCIGGDPR
ncbi:hypothetical protein AB0E76_04680 [Streptomyces fungicidicus]|uniref:hypothetical protein n=1 Tax=Streptomyces fungicidicus TaxID=68203 RepID=UPI0033EA9E0D